MNFSIICKKCGETSVAEGILICCPVCTKEEVREGEIWQTVLKAGEL